MPSLEETIEAQVMIVAHLQENWANSVGREESTQNLSALKTATEVLKNLTEALSHEAAIDAAQYLKESRREEMRAARLKADAK